MSKKQVKTEEESIQDALVPVEEQPYEIPSYWKWAKLGQTIKFISGYAFKSSEYLTEGTPIIRISDLDSDNTTPDNSVCTKFDKKLERFIIHKGDLLIAMSGATTGKLGIYNSDKVAYLNQRVGRIIENESLLNRKYKNLYFKFIQSEILNRAYGGAQPNISASLIENMLIPLPPLDVQKRIADKIERMLDKINQSKQLIEEAQQTFELRRAAILEKAFSGELTRKWREDSGRVFGWKPIIMKDVVIDFKYGTSEKSDYSYGGLPVIRIPNIGEKYIDSSDLKFISSNNDNHIVNSGDLLIIRSNGSKELVGKCAVVNQEHDGFAYASYLIRMRVDKNKVVPEFLYYLMKSNSIKKQLFSNSKSSVGINNINTTELSNLKFNLPDLSEQLVIVDNIISLFAKESTFIETITDLQLHLNVLVNSILSEGFKGSI